MWTEIKGWESPAEQGLLAFLAGSINRPTAEGTIVEIGSEHGMSASIFLTYSDYHALHCIEINPDAPFIQNLMDGHFDMGRVFWRNGSSHEIDWYDGDIDLLFVDGDHSYEGAKKDLEIWSERMAQDGVIAVHDCACSTNKNPHESHYAVMTAIQNWLAETGSAQGWRIAFSVDSTVVLIKAVY